MPSRTGRRVGGNRSGRASLRAGARGFGRSGSRAINGGVVGREDLAQSAMGVRPAGDAVVGAPDERETVLDGAEHGGGGMLPLGGAFAKPTVVGEVHQEIDVVVGGFTAKVGKDVLEADQGRGSRVRAGKDEGDGVVAGGEAAFDGCEPLYEREPAHQWNVFTEDNEVALDVAGDEFAVGADAIG